MAEEFNLEKALLNPSQFFQDPQDILRDAHLQKEEKLKILRAWAYDLELLTVAEEENMGSEEEPPSFLLLRIQNAILDLQEKIDLPS